MPGNNFDSMTRMTVRNLRIREDTAKYLRNLDLNSAYYNPKSRTMRNNPYSNDSNNPEEVGYVGDNFIRYSGDTVSMAQTQLFAWEAYYKGTEVHLQADPTKLELLYQSFKVKKESMKHQQLESIFEKYGGQEYLNAPPRELLLGQTENYVVYSRHGNAIKGEEEATVISKHEEDALINNHTCIFGSYWRDGSWGYKCCHSLVKQSYCIGQEPESKTLLDLHQETKNKKKNNNTYEATKNEKLKTALRAEEQRLKEVAEMMKLDERKRPYNSLKVVRELSEDEIEAFRMKRARPDDPMAYFVNQ